MVLVLLIWPVVLFAQIFEEDLPDSYQNLFDKEALRKERVDMVHAKISIKYDREPIRNTYHHKWLHFNSKGELRNILEVKRYRTRMDSSLIEYHLNNDGRVIFLTESKLGTTSILNREFIEGNISEISYYQMKKTDKWSNRLSPENLIWKETVQREDDKFVYLNQYGKQKMSIRYEKDNRDRITENATFSYNGSISARHLYQYDESGKMISVEEINYNQYLFNWKKEFSYDSDERLEKVEYFKDVELVWFRKVSYLPNGLPEIDITRFEKEGKLEIVHWKYDQY